MFSEPAQTSFDLRFQIFGFPVRVHPLFWLMAILLNLRSDGDLAFFVSWVAAVFLGVLVHELGHAFVMRRYRMDAYIVLYLMGGLAVPRLGTNTRGLHTWPQIAISAAGPVAGMATAYLIVLGLMAAGYREHFVFYGPLSMIPYVFELERERLAGFMNQFFQVNILWGLFNLLPVYPLDGGHISRELFLAYKPHRGIEHSLTVSIVVAVGMAFFAALAWMSVYTTLLFGLLAYQSYQLLEAYRRGGRW